MSNKKTLWTIIPFTALILGVSISNLLVPDRLSSEAENRTLAQRPSLESSNMKEFTSLYDSYYTDQFVGRDELLKFYTKTEIALNKSQVRDNYIIDNSIILPDPIYKLNDEKIDKNRAKIKYVTDKLTDAGVDVFFTMNPSKGESLDYLYPHYVDNDSAIKNPKVFMDSIDDISIHPIGVNNHFINNFTNKERENLFFKTDHHWNGLGAFEGFKYIINEMNKYSPEKYPVTISNDDYSPYSPEEKSFLGSYNLNLFSIFDLNEKVEYYYNKNTVENTFKYLSHNGSDFSEVDKFSLVSPQGYLDTLTYGGFYTYDYPLYKVTNDNAPIDKNILIIRDSYQAPLTTLFADVFESVMIMDPRYINDIGLSCEDVLNMNDIDTVMFMFNSQSFSGMIDLIK